MTLGAAVAAADRPKLGHGVASCHATLLPYPCVWNSGRRGLSIGGGGREAVRSGGIGSIDGRVGTSGRRQLHAIQARSLCGAPFVPGAAGFGGAITHARVKVARRWFRPSAALFPVPVFVKRVVTLGLCGLAAAADPLTLRVRGTVSWSHWVKVPMPVSPHHSSPNSGQDRIVARWYGMVQHLARSLATAMPTARSGSHRSRIVAIRRCIRCRSQRDSVDIGGRFVAARSEDRSSIGISVGNGRSRLGYCRTLAGEHAPFSFDPRAIICE